jgi:thiosulfate/3-mercaptopyruvate sulfurtransferase
MNHLDWTYDEFLAFLLIYVAHVDMEFAEEEKAFIRQTTSTEIFDKMLVRFEAVSDFQAYQTILEYKQTHFPDEQKKAELLDKIQLLFDADAEFNIMEKELLHFLEKMM